MLAVLLFGNIGDNHAIKKVAAILIIEISFLKGSLRLPFKKPILGFAAPKALQTPKLVS